jgi:hypothetical protein
MTENKDPPEKENQVGNLQNHYWELIQINPDQQEIVKTWALISIARSLFQVSKAMKMAYYDKVGKK